MKYTLRVFPDAQALAAEAAAWLAERFQRSSVRLTVSLSGGSTPRRAYELLAGAPYRERIPWSRIHWFWGDERLVPHDSPDSNYAMACEALLWHVPVPSSNVHPVPVDGVSPEQAAIRYEEHLRAHYGAPRLEPGRPLFDVTLLGLGEDGHTASLIPGQPVLGETGRWAAAVTAGRPEPRVTLTFPVLESSRAVLFLVAGSAKRRILAEVLSGSSDAPAARLRPEGDLLWFADAAAAGTMRQSAHGL